MQNATNSGTDFLIMKTLRNNNHMLLTNNYGFSSDMTHDHQDLANSGIKFNKSLN